MDRQTAWDEIGQNFVFEDKTRRYLGEETSSIGGDIFPDFGKGGSQDLYGKGYFLFWSAGGTYHVYDSSIKKYFDSVGNSRCLCSGFGSIKVIANYFKKSKRDSYKYTLEMVLRCL